MTTAASYLLRSFIPSWRFYSGIISSARLRLKLFSPDGSSTDWLPAWPPPTRSWSDIFFNPQGNLTHAYNSLLYQAEVEISLLAEGDTDRFEHTVSFGLLRQLAEQCASAMSNSPTQFQFALERVDPLSGSVDRLLESKRYPLSMPADAAD